MIGPFNHRSSGPDCPPVDSDRVVSVLAEHPPVPLLPVVPHRQHRCEKYPRKSRCSAHPTKTAIIHFAMLSTVNLTRRATSRKTRGEATPDWSDAQILAVIRYV